MKRLANWAAIAAFIAAALTLGLRPTDADANSASMRVERLAAELRCPVCQGLSVLDSDSPTARDIRADIRRRVAAGESAATIRSAYVDRYGKWILLRPSTSGFDGLVWAFPAAAGAAGAVGLSAAFWRWRRDSRGRRPTEDERRLVAAALTRNIAGQAHPQP